MNNMEFLDQVNIVCNQVATSVVHKDEEVFQFMYEACRQQLFVHDKTKKSYSIVMQLIDTPKGCMLES